MNEFQFGANGISEGSVAWRVLDIIPVLRDNKILLSDHNPLQFAQSVQLKFANAFEALLSYYNSFQFRHTRQFKGRVHQLSVTTALDNQVRQTL